MTELTVHPETVTAGPGWVVWFENRLPCPTGLLPRLKEPSSSEFLYEGGERCQPPEPMPTPDGRVQHLRGARWRQ